LTADFTAPALFIIENATAMPNAQFDVERATGGLVMALFVAAALLLAGLLYFVRQDIAARTESSGGDAQTVRFERTGPAVAADSVVPLRSSDSLS
jgi:hypothetical protein